MSIVIEWRKRKVIHMEMRVRRSGGDDDDGGGNGNGKWKHTFNIYAILIGKLIAFTNSIDTFIHEICINFDMHEQQL